MTTDAMHSRCGLRKGLALGLALALAAALARAQAPSETKTFEDVQFRYAVALPAGCRHEEGPGTVDAVCSADFDIERSATASNATALVLMVAAEAVPGDTDKSVSELQRRYGEAAIRGELAEAVCGESDQARVKISNFKEVVEDARILYTADVVCADVKFLQIGERRASVRHVVTPDVRYRLAARAPADDFEQQRATIDAFFASFRVLPAVKDGR